MDHFAAVVEAGVAERVEEGHRRAAPWIGNPEDDAADAGEDDGPGAHQAGFFRHVERARREAPVAESGGGLGDGEPFGVGRGVFEAFDPVVSAADDTGRVPGNFAQNDAPGGDLSGFGGGAGLLQRLPHVAFVVRGLHVAAESPASLRACQIEPHNL